MQTQEKHGGVYNRRDTGKSFEWLSGLGGGRASASPVQRLLVLGGQASGKEMGLGGCRSRGAISLPRLHQQGDCTMCWEKTGIAPLPKKVPQPNKVYVQEKNYMMLLCGLILWNRKSNFKGERKHVKKINQSDS